MGSKWPVVRFDEVAENISRTFKFKGVDNVCFINTGDVSNGKFLHNQLSSVKNLPGQAKKSIVKGDILFSEIRPGNGRFALVDFDDTELFVVSTKFMVIHVNNCLMDNGFLYLQLTSKETLNEFQRIAESRSGTFPQITFDAVSQHLFYCPELKEQQRIKEYIAVIDNKITLNRQINQTLEQMAQALFKSWFVDFDPVVDNALDSGFFEQNSDLPEELLRRAEQRKIVREQPDFKPLPAETRQLFPTAFEACDEPSLGLGGWVPKGWSGRSVSEAITVNPKVKLAKGEMAAFVDMKSLPTTGYSIEDVDRKAFSGGAKFKQHDVLFARITPCLQNGKTGFVDFLSDNENGFGSTEFIVLRGNEFVDCTYVACLARHESFRQHAMQSMVGSSGRQRVQNSCFDDFFIVIPPQNIMNKFAGIVSTSFKKLKTNSDEIISLANVRDTLLPKLISGELRLNDDGTLASGNTDC